jgi:hypothetical protein
MCALPDMKPVFSPTANISIGGGQFRIGDDTRRGHGHGDLALSSGPITIAAPSPAIARQ